jgi:hypothetical protein
MRILNPFITAFEFYHAGKTILNCGQALFALKRGKAEPSVKAAKQSKSRAKEEEAGC